MSERPALSLIAFRPFVKGALRGFADIRLPIGLELFDCPVRLGRNHKLWCGLPAKRQLENGRQAVGPDGKPVYVTIAKWSTRELADRFSELVCGLCLAASPETFAEDEGPLRGADTDGVW